MTEPSAWDGADLSGRVIREVDLSEADLRGAVLLNASIDGLITGLRVNDVEVAPLVEAELDRRHPERVQLRPKDAEGVRTAVQVVEAMWEPTMGRAQALGEPGVHASVDGEWSFAQTLRHLIFVTDAWLGHAGMGEASPFHPIGLGPDFVSDIAALGIDADAKPDYAQVLTARESRLQKLRDFAATLTDDDLHADSGPNPHPGFPPAQARTVASCLQVLFNEEWAHHRFAVRDLAQLESGT